MSAWRVDTAGYLRRDATVGGRPERWFVLPIAGSIHPTLTLGLLAIRCERQGADVVPLTLSIPDDAVFRASDS